MKSFKLDTGKKSILESILGLIVFGVIVALGGGVLIGALIGALVWGIYGGINAYINGRRNQPPN